MSAEAIKSSSQSDSWLKSELESIGQFWGRQFEEIDFANPNSLAKGFGVGATAGAVAGVLITLPLGPAAIPVGGSVGGVFGGAVGVITVIVKKNLCPLPDEPEKGSIEVKKVYICALSGLPLFRAVLLPSGHFVEEVAINHLLEKSSTNPFTGESLTKEGLVRCNGDMDTKKHVRDLIATKEIIEKERDSLQSSAENYNELIKEYNYIINYYNTHIELFNKAAFNIYQMEINGLNNDLKNKKITLVQFNTKASILAQEYLNL